MKLTERLSKILEDRIRLTLTDLKLTGDYSMLQNFWDLLQDADIEGEFNASDEYIKFKDASAIKELKRIMPYLKKEGHDVIIKGL